MSRIYISGPITGVENYIEIFLKKQLELEKLGNEVVNPALLYLIMPNSSTWQEYMDICIPLLKLCDKIAMLKGYENSKGACEELKYALQNGIMLYD